MRCADLELANACCWSGYRSQNSVLLPGASGRTATVAVPVPGAPAAGPTTASANSIDTAPRPYLDKGGPLVYVDDLDKVGFGDVPLSKADRLFTVSSSRHLQGARCKRQRRCWCCCRCRWGACDSSPRDLRGRNGSTRPKRLRAVSRQQGGHSMSAWSLWHLTHMQYSEHHRAVASGDIDTKKLAQGLNPQVCVISQVHNKQSEALC